MPVEAAFGIMDSNNNREGADDKNMIDLFNQLWPEMTMVANL